MLRYLIGIDGGGTKTGVLCVNMDGGVVFSAQSGGTYYRQLGVEGVVRTLREALAPMLDAVGGGEAAICFGMPGYGDSPAKDGEAAGEIQRAFSPAPMRFENDVVCGWAGALALEPGIGIVAGTGSIAYGRDAEGKMARCGGWSEHFSDEGSGYWLGKKLLELFFCQSDGRVARGPLYQIVRRRFALEEDSRLVEVAEKEILPSREQTAALQRELLEAARAGDKSALEAYDAAARELARIVCGAASQLVFPGAVPVAAVGGLFAVEDLVLQPMRRYVSERLDARFSQPRLSPCEGAILLAAQAFAKERVEHLKSVLPGSR